MFLSCIVLESVFTKIITFKIEGYMVKAVSQRQQGSWSLWEAVTNRTITQVRLSFLIRMTYDTLPSPWNLYVWFGSEEICQLCNC